MSASQHALSVALLARRHQQWHGCSQRRASAMCMPCTQSCASCAEPLQSHHHGGVHRAGKQFQDLPFYFPDGIVFGLVNHNSRKVKMNPPPQTIVEAEDELLIVRPTNLPGGIYKAATRPAVRDAGLPSACLSSQCCA